MNIFETLQAISCMYGNVVANHVLKAHDTTDQSYHWTLGPPEELSGMPFISMYFPLKRNDHSKMFLIGWGAGEYPGPSQLIKLICKKESIRLFQADRELYRPKEPREWLELWEAQRAFEIVESNKLHYSNLKLTNNE